jgi:hypothetical protein
MALLIVLGLMVTLLPASCMSSYGGNYHQTSSGIVDLSNDGSEIGTQEAVVTHEHHKLAAADCVESPNWYDDQAGWIEDEATLLAGMRSFYQETGVQPYLIIADQVNGKKNYTDADVESYLRKQYDELFEDDGHLILFFCEAYENYYDPYLLVGEKAATVIDTEGENVIYTAIDRWYTDGSLTDSEYFARIFKASGDALMNGTTFSEYR